MQCPGRVGILFFQLVCARSSAQVAPPALAPRPRRSWRLPLQLGAREGNSCDECASMPTSRLKKRQQRGHRGPGDEASARRCEPKTTDLGAVQRGTVCLYKSLNASMPERRGSKHLKIYINKSDPPRPPRKASMLTNRLQRGNGVHQASDRRHQPIRDLGRARGRIRRALGAAGCAKLSRNCSTNPRTLFDSIGSAQHRSVPWRRCHARGLISHPNVRWCHRPKLL